MKFSKAYFFWFLILFIIEACIAFFIKEGFIRHTFGDVLVVIMLYCLIKSFVKAKPIYTVITVLIVSFGIEFLQLTHILQWLHIENNKALKLILGSTFDINDLLAYLFGIIVVLLIEYKYSKA
ncbi:DUF2809 domain-containing protein [Flavobacteriaceae bacterium PRS1]|nr:DUF2809 domain-containing protein [Flavobacteriaceae bacterium PRS1]